MSVKQTISVIVPVNKVERFLDRCISSIVDQSYSDLEIILIDDGSPDNCPAICDAWAQRDKRIIVVHKENGGLSSARNTGIAKASGDYIAFIDSDDWIAPEMMEKLMEALREDGSDIAACTVQTVFENGIYGPLLTVQKRGVLDQSEAQKALLQESLLKQPVWYKLYRRKIVQDILFEAGRAHEDVFWSYQAIGRARRVSLIDYVGYYYYQRADSIMGKEYSLKRLDAIEAYENRYDYIAEHFPELESMARVAIVNACIYHGQMALKHLTKEEQNKVFIYLNEVKTRHIIHYCDYSDMKLTHQVWLCISRVSLKLVCILKNMGHIGW